MASIQQTLWKRMTIVVLMGFSSGLPFLLTGGTFKMWLAREGIDVKTIGFLSWVGMAYSTKFLWAPFLDRYQLTAWGRRRGWLLLTQVGLIVLIAAMGAFDPGTSLTPMVITAILVAFFSASQDTVIDAYRREFLADEEMGLGASMTTYGYRVAMLVSGGLGIGLVGAEPFNLSWGQLYFGMAALMGVGVLTTSLIPEPKSTEAPLRTLKEAVIEPFREFLSRPRAILFLLFVVAFKLGDSLSGQMLNKFYVDMQFTNQDVGFIAKTVGLISSLLGLFLGGLIIKQLQIYRSLVLFGILQALSTGFFAILVYTGPQRWALALAVVFEDITGGMGSAAFLAFMALLTNRRFTATQYALLSSLATLGRNFFSGFSGVMVEQLGWTQFFMSCAVVAVPGILMAIYIHRQGIDDSVLSTHNLATIKN
jgi:PAT family beta-lactamase induction signal transducer AmpG